MEIDWDIWDQSAWANGLIRAGAAPLQQSWHYGAVMAGLGANVQRGVVRQAGCDVAAVQVLERRGVRLINRGPIWLAPVSPEQKRRILRGLAGHFGLTVVTPAQAINGLGVLPIITARHHALWDLTPGIPALRAGLSPKWRGHLVQAERRNLTIRPNGSATVLETLITADAAQRGDRGYRALPAAFSRAWPAAQRQVWYWANDGICGAAMLFLRHGEWATYQMAWTSAAGRTAFAHGPMLWQAALALRAEGVRVLDLGDISAANPGLANFKSGAGAATVPLGPTCWVLPELGRA